MEALPALPSGATLQPGLQGPAALGPGGLAGGSPPAAELSWGLGEGRGQAPQRRGQAWAVREVCVCFLSVFIEVQFTYHAIQPWKVPFTDF